MRRRRRRREPITIDDLDLPTILDLKSGGGGAAREPGRVEDLRTLWETIGHGLMPSPACPDGHGDAPGDWHREAAGSRPWAWWYFAAGEERPYPAGAEFRRLRVLGVLEPWEEQPTLRRFAQEARRLVQGQLRSAADVAEWLGFEEAIVMKWLEEVPHG